MHNGGYHDFPLKNFSRILPKIFVGDRFVYQKSSCMEKNYEKQVFSTICCQKCSVLQCRITSWGYPLVFQKFSALEQKHEKEGVSRFSIDKFLFHITEGFVVEPFVSKNNWYGKKF